MNRWPVPFLTLVALAGLTGSVATLPAQQSNSGPSLPAAETKPADATPSSPGGEARETAPSDYIIGPEDILDIDVFNVPDLAKTVRVAQDGTIVLAGIGPLRVSGLTTQQLRHELERRWGENYLENPYVSVFVREFHSKPVSIIGAVQRVGVYELKGPRNLIEMLSLAGGLTKTETASAGRTVIVTRKSGFGEDLPMVPGMNLLAFDKLVINLRRLLYSGDAALNIEIKPFDTISVTEADIVYVVGDVRKPGGFVLGDQETITVLQALALAEGLMGTASSKRAKIIRREAGGERMEIPVNLKKVLSGESQDMELAANDILFVPGSTAKTAVKRTAEAVIGTISGMMIYRSAR